MQTDDKNKTKKQKQKKIVVLFFLRKGLAVNLLTTHAAALQSNLIVSY